MADTPQSSRLHELLLEHGVAGASVFAANA